MILSMHTRTFVGWMLVAVTLSLAIGIALGGGFAMYRAGMALDTAMANYDALKSHYNELLALNVKLQDALRTANGTTGKLLERVEGDDAAAVEAAGVATVIYERSPQIQVTFTGLRGLPVIPLPGQGQQLPRVMIPGRVRPLILAPDGDTRQAVFFYVSKDNRMDGPYNPEVVTPDVGVQ
jgi:hypothetical protein